VASMRAVPRPICANRALRPVRLLRTAGCCALLCVAAATAVAADDPHDWLARTERALASLNYEGVFVHQHAGESETLRVIHRVGNGVVAERLLSMDGSGREFIRKGAQLICYLPDQRTVLVERGPDTGMFFGAVPHIDASSAGQYEVKLLDRTRVSGRAARVIGIMPLDRMRYGYRLWIDEISAMPLKTQLRDSRGGVLEQIVFTSLRLPTHIADAELETSIDARAYRWVRHDTDAASAHGSPASWQASSLPPGFHMLASARQILPSGPVQHLVFSDGLASVSVFIENGPAASFNGGSEEIAALGTSSAYSTVIEGYRVIAVGEVPAETVRSIAQSIHSAGPALPDALPAATGASVTAPHAPEVAGDAPAASGMGNSELSILLNDPGNASRGVVSVPPAMDALSDSRAAFGGNGEFSAPSAPPTGGFNRSPGRH
jgi:sigma-E factor negative regulatory protein RseB